MKRKFTLCKGVIINKISEGFYMVKDIQSDEEILMSISAKERLKHSGFDIGRIVYVVVSPYDLSRGRLLSQHDLKSEYASDLIKRKSELDSMDDDT